jgi:hypothetical protein
VSAGPARRLVIGAAVLVLVAASIVGVARWWNDPNAATKDDEHYIAIARSDPQVFRMQTGGSLRATVDRSGRLAVDFWEGDQRLIRVFIHPRTERVEGLLGDGGP